MTEASSTVTRDAEVVRVAGPVTMETAGGLVEAGARLLGEGASRVSFAGVTEVDSAAVAVLLQWLRDARAAGRRVAVEDAPVALVNLARLYAVADLLEIAGKR